MMGYTTDQVAEMTGITARTLRDWARTGRVSPPANGDGRARRMTWTDDDVQRVRSLASGVDEQLPRDVQRVVAPIAQHVSAGQVRADVALPDQVVAVHPGGIRVLQATDTMGELIRRCQTGPVLLILPDSDTSD